MKKLFVLFAAACAFVMSLSAASAKNAQGTLVVYYTWSGNSRIIAEEVQRKTGADIFELEPRTPYSSDSEVVSSEISRDRNANRLPELKSIPNLSSYGTIILVYPMWHADIALPVQTFLRDALGSLSGKKIAPICSNGSSGLVKTVESIKKAVPKAKVTAGLSIRESGGATLSQDLDAWLKKTKVGK